jgi:transcriptional regulator with XRE-family HTH domain
MKDRCFQDVFKELRLEKDLSQDKIAEELDVSSSLVSKWENNQSTPAPEMLEYIADYFNVSVDYLIGRSKYKNLEPDNSELENALFSKAKELSDADKKVILDVMNAIHKDIDKELDN